MNIILRHEGETEDSIPIGRVRCFPAEPAGMAGSFSSTVFALHSTGLQFSYPVGPVGPFTFRKPEPRRPSPHTIQAAETPQDPHRLRWRRRRRPDAWFFRASSNILTPRSPSLGADIHSLKHEPLVPLQTLNNLRPRGLTTQPMSTAW